ncbi:hypothetical protein GJW-30_1_03618 [Variibacter gotjawalensis]|uniref:N-acetyltransferase domain-containing protein n=2 Tax=Variibacter gotjawalensis TaxID=1333996 RepID=A0A0S3PYN4_9BRAD|nr:hypothetical protein GJW-30_1_03618 [Variibacter gotjawalensis]
MDAIRPVEDEARLAAMLAGANLIVTARRAEDGKLIGISRSITDFSWVCYLAELAVSAEAQKLGIGQGLLAEMRRILGSGVSIVLQSVPEAVGFYQRAGMKPASDTFIYRRKQ